MFDILELIFYYGVTIVPLAVPITILISSVMVFGDMSERHELSSMKSAGVSLLRVMRPAITIAILTALFSIFSSNFLKPRANYLFIKRFTALRKQKPAMTIEEGIFNKDFKGFAIRVDSKGDDDQTINDVLIYDHTSSDKSKMSLIKSKTGRMYTSESGNRFVMNLEDGYQYRELATGFSKSSAKNTKYPFVRTKFGTWQKVFDMGEFEMDANSININRNKEDMLTTPQLLVAIDSVNLEQQKIKESVLDDYDAVVDIYAVKARKEARDSTLSEKYNKGSTLDESEELISAVSPGKKYKTRINNTAKRGKKIAAPNISYIDSNKNIESAVTLMDIVDDSKLVEVSKEAANKATNRRDVIKGIVSNLNQLRKNESRYHLKLHQSYSWALICIIFLFIGAPLGSIIRKGGYGYPLLVAILFYMIFMIMTIMGDKLNKSESIDPVLAAWMPCIILSPIAAWLTMKAMKDSKFTAAQKIMTWISKKLGAIRNKKSDPNISLSK